MQRMSIPPTDLLTADEAAALVFKKPGTIRAWVARGRLPCTRIVGRVYVRREDVLALVEVCAAGARRGDQ